MTVEEMLKLSAGLRDLGVLAFEAGDFKVSFSLPQTNPSPLDVKSVLDGLDDISEDDLFHSSGA